MVGSMPGRIVLLCLLALVALAAPATASAQDEQQWEEPKEQWVEPADEEWPEDGGEVEAPPVEDPAPAAPVEVPAPAPLPPAEEDGDWPDEEEAEQPPIVTGKTVLGVTARLRADGRAAVPLGAPVRVRRLISAINEIIGRPYKWGGGHGRIFDRGYDCSGSVSYGLIRTGLLSTPLVSGAFARWARPGHGRWMTIYANRGHAYMEVAGLRLDTSSMGDADSREGVRWRQPIGQRRGFRARHVAGL
jgi:cell wall-associated NlpC family hydrolase